MRCEDKHHPDHNEAQRLSGPRMDGFRFDLVEVVLQIQAKVVDTMFKEGITDSFRILKELDNTHVLASYQTNNIPDLLRQLKVGVHEVEGLSPDWLRYQLKQEL